MNVLEVRGLHFEELDDEWKKKMAPSYQELIRRIGEKYAKTFIIYANSKNEFTGWGSDLNDD